MREAFDLSSPFKASMGAAFVASRRTITKGAVGELLTGTHEEAARLLIELGLVANEAELIELALREFIEEELRYIASEWPEETARRKARTLLDKIAWL